MKNIFYTVLAFYTLSFACCITRYTPDLEDMGESILVIEGTITNGETKIRLSKTAQLDYYSVSPIYVFGDLTIESNDGTIWPLKHTGNGWHITDMGELDPGKSYRLNIEYGGELYRSPFLHPMLTPEIDTIYYKKEREGSPVRICADITNQNQSESYYRWQYEEDWQFNVELFADADYKIVGRDTILVRYTLATSNNLYYCWGHNQSTGLIVGSSKNLAGNVLKEQTILEKAPSDDRWMTLYKIKLTQNLIRKEAYEYFDNLQKNIEQGGGIFLPIPTEIKGNITCISNPGIPAIGFIEVSTTTHKEAYIAGGAHIHEPIDLDCLAEVDRFGDKLFRYDPPGSLYAPAKCVDCTYDERGTKIRPENWQTDNY